jgi:hypothetical protein
MKKQAFSKVVISSLMSAAVLASGSVYAAGKGGTPLPAIDSVVSTTFDKSVIHGSLAHKPDGTLAYDKAGNARFVYTGKIYSVETDDETGDLSKMSDDPIGDISGEAAFPKDFVILSTAVNVIMDQMMAGTFTGPMPPMPSVIPWTCNHCDMTVAGTRYVSIVDVLDEDSPFYNQDMADKFDAGLMDGSAGALDNMRMKGRAFTGLTPASFDPSTKTMGVRMAGCSALVAISGPKAGKMGTLCMNATAVFDVSKTKAIGAYPNGFPIYDETSDISAEGSSNCVTVLHTPTM